ncbi:hypothetical protein Pmi06nite_63780 [Planotetraspora mira]|uniref:Helix-turn-helix domain-containing protein n=2 Tax=Planotetraspora mira TaxID=58121 RepID=A0A8J3TUY0_9ACTN|nr:hypothetical protein Pmi06nite_63780 [Planotetraspora mira]
MLASVSTDYYVRLEQGRERNPSGQVLGALARVLQLDLQATEHLYALACPRTSKCRPTDRVHPNVLRLLEACRHEMAFIVNRRFDVLASAVTGNDHRVRASTSAPIGCEDTSGRRRESRWQNRSGCAG